MNDLKNGTGSTGYQLHKAANERVTKGGVEAEAD
jgi:hypothetical protein